MNRTSYTSGSNKLAAQEKNFLYINFGSNISVIQSGNTGLKSVKQKLVALKWVIERYHYFDELLISILSYCNSTR